MVRDDDADGRARGRAPRSVSAQLFAGLSRRKLGLVLLMSGLGGLFEASLLVLIVQVTTHATGTASGQQSGVLSGLLGDLTVMRGVVLGTIFAALSITLQLAASRRMMAIAAERLDADRARILDTFYASAVADQSQMPIGTIPDLAANHANKYADAVYQNGQSASAWVNLAVLALAAFLASPWTALAMILVAGLAGLVFAPISRSVTHRSRSWMIETRGYNGFLSVYTRLFLEVRVFGVSPRVQEIALAQSRDSTESWRRGRTLQTATPIAFRNIVLLLGFLCIGTVALISPSSVAGVAITALLLVRGLVYLQAILLNRQSVKAQATNGELIDRTLRALPPDPATWGSSPLERIERVRLVDVAYRYPDGRAPFLGVDLELRRGQFAAIVGPSGGGKTTLLKILMRTIEPTVGAVLVNDRPIEEVRRDAWYSAVAYLSQEVRLIPGTLADNIRFFRDAPDAEVERAARDAALELDATALFPQGLGSPVEQDGLNLSGGQRQRIGLARCLLLRPQLLVLDEPTSALDVKTEAAIMETIRALHERMIIVMVSHRPSTLEFTDVQYLMANGRLTAIGYDELVSVETILNEALADGSDAPAPDAPLPRG